MAADADQIRSAYICIMNSIQTGDLDLQGPLSYSEHRPPVRFISKDLHSATTPEVLSDRWRISIAQAKITLKYTTSKLLPTAFMPLAQRYRVYRMFETLRLLSKTETDTMDARY